MVPIQRSNPALDAEIKAVTSLLKTDLSPYLGNYVYLVDPAKLEVYGLKLEAFARSYFNNNFPANKFDYRLMDFRVQAEQFIRLVLLYGLLIEVVVNSDIRNILSSVAFSQIEAFLVTTIIDNNSISKDEFKLLNLTVTLDKLITLMREIQQNIVGCYLQSVIYHSPHVIDSIFKKNKLEMSAYNTWLVAKRLGHKFGFKLSTGATFNIPLMRLGTKVGTLNCDADNTMSRKQGYAWVKEVFEDYFNKKFSELSAPVRNDLLMINRVYQRALRYGYVEFKAEKSPRYNISNNPALNFKQSSIELHEDYKAGEIIILSCGWQGEMDSHAVGLAVKDYFLVYCNRGAFAGFENCSFGIYIYQLSNRITLAQLEKINEIAATPQLFTDALTEIVGNPNTHLFHISLKKQKRGNCSFASIKSLLAGLLFINELTRNFSIYAGAYASDIDRAMTYSHPLYKNITSFMRIDELLELAELIKTANVPTRQVCIVFIARIIMSHHHAAQTQIAWALRNLSTTDLTKIKAEIARYPRVDAALDDFLRVLSTKAGIANNTHANNYPAHLQFFQPKYTIKTEILTAINRFVTNTKNGKGVDTATALLATLHPVNDNDINRMMQILFATSNLIQVPHKNNRSSSYKLSLVLNQLLDKYNINRPQELPLQTSRTYLSA